MKQLDEMIASKDQSCLTVRIIKANEKGLDKIIQKQSTQVLCKYFLTLFDFF